MVSAIIVAAGRGTRMGPGVDKLFLEVAGRPVVAHTWGRFNRAGCIDEVVLVVRSGMEEEFREMARRYGFAKPFRCVSGGPERQDSVWNGLEALDPAAEIVAIQDGARPCTPEALIEATVTAARSEGAAVAATKVTDTLKEADGSGRVVRTVDRSRLWAVQTPQAFRVGVIRAALARVRIEGRLVTDDTAACEVTGQPVVLVESPGPNPKVTVPADLACIELLMGRGGTGGGGEP